MPRTRIAPILHVPQALVVVAVVTATLGAVAIPAGAAGASPDTLSVQVVTLDRDTHEFLLDAVGDRSLDPETLYDKVGMAAGGALAGVEATCRSNLLPRHSEPGSPWLGWRLLARARRDSCDWFIGSLSCADTLCGALVSHERVALLSITPARARILLYPGQPATIGDEGSCQVDSVALFKGSSHLLLQARRRSSSEHPCADGPGRSTAVAADFFVLRGDRVLQAFTLETSAESVDHDDEGGDRGVTTTGTLVASATAIQLDRRTDEWQEAADGDPKKTQHRTRGAKVRLRFDDGSGTYMGLGD